MPLNYNWIYLYGFKLKWKHWWRSCHHGTAQHRFTNKSNFLTLSFNSKPTPEYRFDRKETKNFWWISFSDIFYPKIFSILRIKYSTLWYPPDMYQVIFFTTSGNKMMFSECFSGLAPTCCNEDRTIIMNSDFPAFRITCCSRL